jgi:multiple sugar transport system permease protein
MRTRTSQVLLNLVLALGAIVTIFPFYWMITSAFKPPQELFSSPPTFFPHQWTLASFTGTFELIHYGRFYLNSVFVAVATTVIQVFTSSLAGYVFSKFRFRGRDIMFFLILATMMVPFQAIIVPLYIEMAAIGWIDTYVALIIPMAVSAFGIFLMRQYMTNIPSDYLYSARIDGLTEFRIYLQLILPMSVTAVSALIILTFLGQWNSLLWPLVVVGSEDKKTLPLGIMLLVHSRGARYDLHLAASFLMVVPVLVVFFFFQRNFIRGIAYTGLKG